MPTSETVETKTVLLTSLTLEEFKGIRQFRLEPSELTSIYGDNGTGKTTLFDALCWLLTGKDSLGRADFDVKRLNADGEAIPQIEHSVEAEFAICDGTLTLKKTLSEKWVKKRGQADREFSGHETAYEVDGVPTTAKQFASRVSAICPPELLRVLTDPRHFAGSVHWQDRRKMLLEVCGDLTDNEVLEADPKLKDLPGILSGRTLDDTRAVLTAERRKINQKLEAIPTRIDEARRSLPEVEESEADLVEKIQKLRKRRQELEAERMQATEGGIVAKLKVQLQEIEASIREQRGKLETFAAVADSERRHKLREAQEAVRDLKSTHRTTEAELKTAGERMANLSSEMDDLRARFFEIDGETFEFRDTDTCAACGQDLPASQVETARIKAEKEFNLAKSRRLESTKAAGQEKKRAFEAVEKLEDRLTKRLSEIAKKLEKAESTYASIAAQPEVVPDYDGDADLQDLLIQREKIVARLDGKSTVHDTSELDTKIADLEAHIEQEEKALAKVRQRVSTKRRIVELQEQQRSLAQQFEECERGLFLCDLFIRRKVAILDERINAQFKLAQFRLFRVQVNGALEERCDVASGGVPWGSLNHGGQIQAGLDIIETLQRYYGIRLPVFIDHAESVTSLPEMECQVIRLVVSESDKELRVVHESERGKLR